MPLFYCFLGGHLDPDHGTDLSMHLELDLMGAQRLERLGEIELAAVDLDALRGEGLGDLAGP